jgi:phosphoribosylformylglycinamidine cyclo-ligase
LIPELGATVGQALLAPHRSYLRLVLPLVGAGVVKGLAHITGGGITENLPRILPEGCGAAIDTARWEIPSIFTLVRTRGGIEAVEMFRTFNMGIGLIVVAAPSDAARVQDMLERSAGHGAVRLGEVVAGNRSVRYSNLS